MQDLGDDQPDKMKEPLLNSEKEKEPENKTNLFYDKDNESQFLQPKNEDITKGNKTSN
jgi:hypothetical protein